ncbi:hypothetical protein I317_02099 [Kwoniella heveanensis CBS 569]|nr:hypothetical protein I317_02099 [Kwoniella heveanensis CBS 569]
MSSAPSLRLSPAPQQGTREYADVDRAQLPPDVAGAGASIGAEQADATTSSPTASAVDAYLNSKILHPSFGADESLARGLQRADEEGLPRIAVSPQQGQFLSVLAKSIGAERILEIGTLGGYSTSFLAKALPFHGRIDTLELEPKHAKVAQANFLDSDLYPFPQIIIGLALQSLKKLSQPEEGAYDLVFIDANKDQILEYFLEALRLTRTGGVIVVDNAIRQGKIILENNTNEDINVSGLRKLYDWVEKDQGKTVLMSAIQTVGGKSWE